MPNQYLQDSINWLDAPSGGALSQNYMTTWGLSNREMLAQANSTNISAMTPISYNLSGTTGDGYFSYDTTVRVTGAIPVEHQQAALCRIVSLWILGNLDDRSIIEACDNLSDIYTAQLEDSHVSLSIPRFSGVANSTTQLGKLW
jgi:hypothetical protein